MTDHDAKPAPSPSGPTLDQLLGRGEGQFLEFKSAWDRTPGRQRARRAAEVARDVAEALAAMANADGGTVVVGVEDDGTVTCVFRRIRPVIPIHRDQ